MLGPSGFGDARWVSARSTSARGISGSRLATLLQATSVVARRLCHGGEAAEATGLVSAVSRASRHGAGKLPPVRAVLPRRADTAVASHLVLGAGMACVSLSQRKRARP